MSSIEKSYNVAAAICIYSPTPDSSDLEKEYFLELLKDVEIALNELMKSLLKGSNAHVILSRERPQFFPHPVTHSQRTGTYIELRATASQIEKKLPNSARITFWDPGHSSLCQLLHEFVLLMNICLPGIRCGKVYSLSPQDGYYSPGNTHMISCLGSAVAIAEDRGWPQLKYVPPAKVFAWANIKSPNDSLFRLQGSTSLSRALSGFSYFFVENFSEVNMGISKLIHCTLALEALYCDRIEGITEQLHRRTELVLGKRDSFKRTVKSLYSRRSKYVHGSEPFLHAFDTRDATQQAEDFFGTYFESLIIGSAVLTATLQHMVEQNIHELTFIERYQPNTCE